MRQYDLLMDDPNYRCPACKADQLVVGYTYRKQLRVALAWALTLTCVVFGVTLIKVHILRIQDHWLSYVFDFGWLSALILLFPRIGAWAGGRDFFWKCKACGVKRPLLDLQSVKEIEAQTQEK